MKTKATITILNNCRGLSQWTMAVALLLFLAVAGAARAVSVTNVIYYDTFHRTGSLEGSAPDTVNLPGGVWCGGVGTNGIVTDGSEASITNVEPFAPPYQNEFLPLNMEAGHIYVVTCTIVGNSNAPGTMIFGYSIYPSLLAGPAGNGNQYINWVQVACSNNVCAFWEYGGIKVLNQNINYPWTQSMTYSTRMDLTGCLPNGALTNLLGTYYTNGVPVPIYTNGVLEGNSYFATTNTGTGRTEEHGMFPGYVFIGTGPTNLANVGGGLAAGYFQNFTVTDIVPNATTPTIIDPPNSLTTTVGKTATFWVRGYALPDPAYQWQINTGSGFVNISGATSASYTTPPLSAANSGAQYNVVLSTAAGSTTSSAATLTVNAGTPAVYSVEKTASLNNIVVNFSSPIDPTTGLNAANYALLLSSGASAGVSVSSVAYGSSSNNVILTTSTLNPATGYYLGVQNVQDQFGQTVNTSTNPVLPAGLVFYYRADLGVELDTNNKVAQWLDMSTNGNNASQFFGMYSNINSAFLPSPAARPATNSFGNNNLPGISFNGSSDFLTIPPTEQMDLSGNLTMYFYGSPANNSAQEVMANNNGNIACGFELQLAGTTLSPDLLYGDGNNYGSWNAGGGNIAVAPHVWSLTAQDIGQDYVGTPPLSSIVLTTNNIYWYVDGSPYGLGANGTGHSISAQAAVRATFNDRPVFLGGRIDHGAWFNGSMGEVMLFSGPLADADRTNLDNYLGQKYFTFSGITANLPATTTSSNGFPVTYSITLTQGSYHFGYQWQVNGTNIPGANNSIYTTPILGPANSNTTYDVVITLPNGTTITSVTNTLTVLPAPPYVMTDGMALWESPNPTNIVLVFDLPVDPVTATTTANYTLNSGSVLSAAIGDAPNKVVLTTTSLSWNANPGNYTVMVQNVQDLYGDVIVSTTLPVGLYPVTSLWLESTNGISLDSNGSYLGVSSWSDQSGNGNTVSDNNFGAPYEPLYTTNAFGHVVVRYNDTNATLYTLTTANSSPSLAITGDMAVFAVMTFANLSTATNGAIVSKDGNSPNNNKAGSYDYYCAATNSVQFYRGNGTATFGTITSTTGPIVGYPLLLGMNETGNNVVQYINENVGVSNSLSGGWQETNDADIGNPLYVGGRLDGHNRLIGDITEMIIINQTLDPNEATLVQNYLASKYNVPTGINSYALISQQPVASTNIIQTQTLTVPAAANGTPQVTYQWYDTNNILQAGQTNATLVISNIQVNDSYYLVASNTFNTATSSVVTVTVNSGLNVSLGPPSVTLYTGQSYTMNALTTGIPPFYYQWYQGASPILNATNASYTVVASSPTSYSCTVTNAINGYSSTNAGPVTISSIAAPSNAFSQMILGYGPIAYWRLNEASGSPIAYDYVGGYNGTYGASTTNGLPGVPYFAAGELGVAMDNTVTTNNNNNTNGYISVPAINLNTNSVTLLCWVFPFTNQLNPSGLVFSRTGANPVFGSQIGSSENLAYTWNNNSSTYGYGSGLVVKTNIWSLTALTITPSNAVLYVFNSAYSGGTAVNGVANPVQSFAGGLTIGADNQSTNRIFNGEMDEVALFNYTLSASQLGQLYYAATGTPASTNATKVVFSVPVNNQMTLSWPGDHTGWQLQAQTNSVSVGISTNWVNVSPSTGTNQVAVPVNLTNGSVFYRLVYP